MEIWGVAAEHNAKEHTRKMNDDGNSRSLLFDFWVLDLALVCFGRRREPLHYFQCVSVFERIWRRPLVCACVSRVSSTVYSNYFLLLICDCRTFDCTPTRLWTRSSFSFLLFFSAPLATRKIDFDFVITYFSISIAANTNTNNSAIQHTQSVRIEMTKTTRIKYVFVLSLHVDFSWAAQ